jgi:translocation and assembly module TamA
MAAAASVAVDEFAGGTAALRYRLDQGLALQAGVKFEQGWAADSLGRDNYTFLGFPVSLRYDNTDDLLNPASGVRVSASITPYPSFFGSAGFIKTSVAGSAYFALDDRADYILAGRAGFGSIFANSVGLAEIPANYRFYEGGSQPFAAIANRASALILIALRLYHRRPQRLQCGD